MASFRKRGSVWRAEIYKNGIRESGTFETKREAQDWANHREIELTGSTQAGIVAKPLRTVLERYSDEIAPNNKGKRWDQVRIKRFLADEKTLCDKPMHLVTVTDLADWRDKRLKSVQPASVRRDIALLRTVWRYARKEWRNIKVDVWLELTIPQKGKNRNRLWTPQEIDEVVKATGYVEGEPVRDKRHQVAIAFLLSLETAMRSGELMDLEWANIDLKGRVARLTDSKNNDSRDVPLSTRAAELLEKLRGIDKKHPFTLTDGLRDTYFRQAKEFAGIKDATFHDARATALTRLAKKLSILELARMVGHRDPRSLMIYYRESASNIAKRLD